MSEAVGRRPNRAAMTPYGCDASAPPNIDRLFEDVVKMMGGIDLFITKLTPALRITKKSARPIGIEMQPPIPWPPSCRNMRCAIVRGIEHDRHSVYPSKLFRLILLLDRLLPFARRIERRLELRNFEKWQAKQKLRQISDAIKGVLLLIRSAFSF